MQDLCLFFRLIVLFFLVLNPLSVLRAASKEANLEIADSLFQKGNFEQALLNYEKNYKEGKSYSLSSLLKMSFLYEEKGNLVQAVYFLSLYRAHTHNQKATEKMIQLAAQHHLQGYEESEWDSFFYLFKQNQFLCSIVLVFLSFFLISILFYQKSKKQPLSVLLLVLSILLLVLLSFCTTYQLPSKAIISQNKTYIMSEPAASATSIGFFQKGDRVTIQGSSDIWNKIKWNGKSGYVKKYDLLYLP